MSFFILGSPVTAELRTAQLHSSIKLKMPLFNKNKSIQKLMSLPQRRLTSVFDLVLDQVGTNRLCFKFPGLHDYF